MNKLFGFLLILCFASASCVPIVKDKDDPVTNPTTNPDVAWDPLIKVSPELLVKSVHSTPTELHILTNNQLYRTNVTPCNLVAQISAPLDFR